MVLLVEICWSFTESFQTVIMGLIFQQGSVQTILPLNNGTAIKLTTARTLLLKVINQAKGTGIVVSQQL